MVGGTPSGVAETVADGGDVPTAFVAVTAKEYAVPFARPGTVQELTEAAAGHVAPPGDAVTA
jgi:hypothetical protein